MTKRDAVDVAAEPAAWVDFAARGHVRFWTADWHRANRETKAGRAMQPLYTVDALRSVSNSRAEAMREAAVSVIVSHARQAPEGSTIDKLYQDTARVVRAPPLPAPGAPASPWRDMETAPKTGDEIDVWVGGEFPRRVPDVSWRKPTDSEWWVHGGDTIETADPAWHDCFGPLGKEGQPVAWMPRPTPPASKDT